MANSKVLDTAVTELEAHSAELLFEAFSWEQMTNLNFVTASVCCSRLKV
jgi:hypothetical protein